MQRMLKQIESIDVKHRELIRSFFDSSKALSKKIKETVKATTSVATSTPLTATAYATPGSAAVVPKAGAFMERLRMTHQNE